MLHLQRCVVAEQLAWKDASPRKGAQAPFVGDEAQRALEIWRRKKSELGIAIEELVICHRALTLLE